MDIKKICAALCACVVCLCAAGCSKDSKESSSVTESKANVSTADNADSAKSEDSKCDESDTDSKVLNEQGELIKKTAAIFDGDYTLKTTCTEADGSKQEVVRAKKGGNIYLKVTSDIGTSGFIYVDGAGYDYDNVTGVYHKSDVTELDGVLESIVKQNLPRTYGHINSDEADDFDIEEYTYTGDTYITAIDLYFDKSDGSLKKYTQTFTIEGSDDTVSEYTVDELSGDADASLFDVSQATSLVAFDSMSEDQRLGYCQGILNKAGVTTDDLSAGGYQTDDLKTISYDSFVSLVYTYGYKPAQGLATDVAALKRNGLEVSCVNLSCGYYEPHTDNEYTILADLCKCYRFVRHIICCHKETSTHIPETERKPFPGYYELFVPAGYSEKDYIRLSKEYRSEFTKTSKTSHKNKL